jgi:hypothetical protein
MNYLYFTEYHEQPLFYKLWKADDQQQQQTQVDFSGSSVVRYGCGEHGRFSAHFKISTFYDRTIKNWSCDQSSQPS